MFEPNTTEFCQLFHHTILKLVLNYRSVILLPFMYYSKTWISCFLGRKCKLELCAAESAELIADTFELGDSLELCSIYSSRIACTGLVLPTTVYDFFVKFNTL